jgi:hypothetical protein
MRTLLFLGAIAVAFAQLQEGWAVGLGGGALACLLAYQGYLYFYFKSNTFLELKKALRGHVEGCNALNSHLAELKNTYAAGQAQNFGQASIADTSVFKFKITEWAKTVNAHWVYNCSATVAKNAHSQPFKYLCKYFNIPTNEETLNLLEQTLNNFAAAEQGKHLLLKEREDLVDSVRSSTPVAVRLFSKKRFERALGFQPVDLSDLHVPIYSFQYVSAAGKSSFNCDIELDTPNLELFAAYLSNLVKFRKSIAGQRALMTTSLREKIKARDRHTCQLCGLSTADEKNLLLEIDHKIPLSRGGITSEANLQTLCWRCNRKKGSKLA